MEKIKQLIQNTMNSEVTQVTPLPNPGASQCFIVNTNGAQYFAKITQQDNMSLAQEATGLKQLREVYPHVPETIAFSKYVLVTDYIAPEAPSEAFWTALGTELSEMHKKKQHNFGFFENNYIGDSTQENLCSETEAKNWASFFWKHRIQYKLNQLKTHSSYELDSSDYNELKIKVFEQLNEIDAKPTLVHGDLWSGNVICGPGQKPFLIDPSVYFGHSETDLAMTECFGGFNPKFYQSYTKNTPLETGYEQRKHIYNLYHMLNHLLIFGKSYESGVEHIVKLITN